jgi:hypothetical protein
VQAENINKMNIDKMLNPDNLPLLIGRRYARVPLQAPGAPANAIA